MSSVTEGLGTSLLDAMACGKPIVATTAGGMPEVVADGETGFLVPPRDHEAMADAIVRLLKDEAAAQADGRQPAGRARAEAFSAERMVQDTLRRLPARRDASASGGLRQSSQNPAPNSHVGVKVANRRTWSWRLERLHLIAARPDLHPDCPRGQSSNVTAAPFARTSRRGRCGATACRRARSGSPAPSSSPVRGVEDAQLVAVDDEADAVRRPSSRRFPRSARCRAPARPPAPRPRASVPSQSVWHQSGGARLLADEGDAARFGGRRGHQLLDRAGALSRQIGRDDRREGDGEQRRGLQPARSPQRAGGTFPSADIAYLPAGGRSRRRSSCRRGTAKSRSAPDRADRARAATR